MRAKNTEEIKLTCPKCSTEVCFKCRDTWHGADVTCEAAMKKHLEGWADENKDNVSFCPLCRTKIEKNQGCNHMTCGFCGYEFCWACGASASGADNHFGLMRGCGVKMMDENVKPGDGRKRSVGCEICILVVKCLLCPIWWPLMMVFYCPVAMAYGTAKAFSNECGCMGAFIGVIFGFMFGLILNVCFIPLFLIGSLCYFLVIICLAVAWCVQGCKCSALPN